MPLAAFTGPDFGENFERDLILLGLALLVWIGFCIFSWFRWRWYIAAALTALLPVVIVLGVAVGRLTRAEEEPIFWSALFQPCLERRGFTTEERDGIVVARKEEDRLRLLDYGEATNAESMAGRPGIDEQRSRARRVFGRRTGHDVRGVPTPVAAR